MFGIFKKLFLARNSAGESTSPSKGFFCMATVATILSGSCIYILIYVNSEICHVFKFYRRAEKNTRMLHIYSLLT